MTRRPKFLSVSMYRGPDGPDADGGAMVCLNTPFDSLHIPEAAQLDVDEASAPLEGPLSGSAASGSDSSLAPSDELCRLREFGFAVVGAATRQAAIESCDAEDLRNFGLAAVGRWRPEWAVEAGTEPATLVGDEVGAARPEKGCGVHAVEELLPGQLEEPVEALTGLMTTSN